MAEEKSIYEFAKDEYLSLTKFLEDFVFPARAEFEKSRGNNDYKPEYGLASFDIFLQYSLLQIAVADGKIDENEIEFIKDLFEYFPITEFYKAHGLRGFDWSFFLEKDIEVIAKLLDDSREDVLELTNDFASSFALLDANIPDRDFYKALERSVSAFMTALSCADGEQSKEEKEYKCIIYGVLHYIRDAKKELSSKGIKDETPDEEAKEKGNEDVRSRKRGKSLKDFYERKKLDLATTDMQVDYTEKEKSLVYIEVYDGKGSSGSGSGFIITESGLCFTCYHVVDGAKEIYVRLDDGNGNREVKPAIVTYGDEDDDFAIIQILEVNRCHFLKLEDNYSDVKTGDEIAIYGFPFGSSLNEDVMDLEPTLTRGYVASKNKVEGKSVYYLDARSCPGNSGGPVFSIKTKKVIGYLCGSYGQDRANLVYCRSLSEFFDTIVHK